VKSNDVHNKNAKNVQKKMNSNTETCCNIAYRKRLLPFSPFFFHAHAYIANARMSLLMPAFTRGLGDMIGIQYRALGFFGFMEG
jgi:hypothetical protein